MIETPTSRVWLGIAGFLIVGFVVLIARILPIGTEPTIVPYPDIMLAVTLAWVTRRPDLAPFFAIALLFFLADLILQRPPGLYTAVVLVFTDILRRRTEGMRNLPFILEWMAIAAILAGIAVAYL